MARSAINAHLQALAVGRSVTLPRAALAPAYRNLPAKLAREFGARTKKRIRALSTRAGVMFVRTE